MSRDILFNLKFDKKISRGILVFTTTYGSGKNLFFGIIKMLKELPIELENQIDLPPDVFLFVNPLNGRHAKFKDSDSLAVFNNENTARKWEIKSKVLNKMVGYYCTWEEMLAIASNETGGKYEYFRDCG